MKTRSMERQTGAKSFIMRFFSSGDNESGTLKMLCNQSIFHFGIIEYSTTQANRDMLKCMHVPNMKKMKIMDGCWNRRGKNSPTRSGGINPYCRGLITTGGLTLVSQHAFSTKAIWLIKPMPWSDRTQLKHILPHLKAQFCSRHHRKVTDCIWCCWNVYSQSISRWQGGQISESFGHTLQCRVI